MSIPTGFHGTNVIVHGPPRLVVNCYFQIGMEGRKLKKSVGQSLEGWGKRGGGEEEERTILVKKHGRLEPILDPILQTARKKHFGGFVNVRVHGFSSIKLLFCGGGIQSS